MKKYIFIVLLMAVNIGYSQKVDIDAIVLKSDGYKSEKKYDQGIKYLQTNLKKNPFYGRLWDELVEFYNIKDKNSNNINLLLKDLNNQKKLNELISNALVKPDYQKMIYTARFGSACGYGSNWCDIMLRIYKIDQPVDTAITKDALDYFNQAEVEFGNRNYDKAINNYKKAIAIDSLFYKANLYLGDTYYAMHDYKNAIKYFKQSIQAQPNLLEPRKYLVDAYIHSNAYEYALTECIDAICIYPDFSMMLKLQNIHEELGNKFNIERLIRTELPNGYGLTQKYLKDVVVVKTDKNSIWKKYTEGLKNFRDVAGEQEIIYDKVKQTPIQYAEIESWRYMLKTSNSTYLDYAKKTDEDGYLECFIMIDNFHYDFYDQFKVWVSYNKSKVVDYLTNYRIK